MNDDDARLLESIRQFRADAAALCDFIDDVVARRAVGNYRRLLQLLSALAVSGCALPWADSDDPNYDLPDASTEESSAVSRGLDGATSAAVRDLAAFYEGIDDDSLSGFMLFDDLGGIYQDLSLGLRLLERGRDGDVAKAIWNWRFRYESHWARHLFGALKTVHEICFRLDRD